MRLTKAMGLHLYPGRGCGRDAPSGMWHLTTVQDHSVLQIATGWPSASSIALPDAIPMSSFGGLEVRAQALGPRPSQQLRVCHATHFRITYLHVAY